ncbi:hypothetical protein [Sphingobium terrigena]
MEPEEDVKPYHKRQIIALPRDRWADWLNPASQQAKRCASYSRAG